MIIYIVAGERNIQAVDFFGGLYFNLGQTDRSVEERLKDPDYRRKNAGGKWVILHEWEVEDSLTDSVFHEILEDSGINRSGTNNTEEFFAPGDDGTADEAAKIVQDYINEHSVQKVKYENIRLKAFLAYRDAQLEELSKEFAELNDEYQNYKLTDASKLIDDALKEKGEVEQQVADLLEETRKKEEELEQKIKDVKTRQIYLDKAIEITEEDKRWVAAEKEKYEKAKTIKPVKLKDDEISVPFKWVFFAVFLFSIWWCTYEAKKLDKLNDLRRKLRVENYQVEQKSKAIKKLEQQLKKSNDELSKLKQPKKEVKTKVLTKLDSKHLKPLTKKEVEGYSYYNNRQCKSGAIYSWGGSIDGFLSSCSGVKNSKNFNVATSICDFKKGTVIFGFYEPADSKRKGKAYVMKVLHDPKSLYGKGYEGTIWFTRETCLLNK